MLNMEKLIEEVKRFPVLYDQSNDKYRNSEHKERIWKIIAKNLEAEGGVEECKKKWSSMRDQLRRTLQKRKTKSGQPAFKIHKYKYEDVLLFLIPHLGEREGQSDVPKQQHDEECDEVETFINYEDFVEVKSEQLAVEEPAVDKFTTEEFITQKVPVEDTNILGSSTSMISSIQPSQSKSVVAKQKPTKRKMTRPEEVKDSPARQLMAYILAEKEAEKNPTPQHPVDAFLGGIAPPLKLLNPYLWNEAKGRIFTVVQEMEVKQLQLNATAQDQNNPLQNIFGHPSQSPLSYTVSRSSSNSPSHVTENSTDSSR